MHKKHTILRIKYAYRCKTEIEQFVSDLNVLVDKQMLTNLSASTLFRKLLN